MDHQWIGGVAHHIPNVYLFRAERKTCLRAVSYHLKNSKMTLPDVVVDGGGLLFVVSMAEGKLLTVLATGNTRRMKWRTAVVDCRMAGWPSIERNPRPVMTLLVAHWIHVLSCSLVNGSQICNRSAILCFARYTADHHHNQ